VKTICLSVLIAASLLALKSLAQPAPVVVSVRLVDLVKDCSHRDAAVKKSCEDKTVKLVLNNDGTVGWQR
jgi:hypothetical protein